MSKAPTIITREGHTVGKTEEFKRPSHPDFSDSLELVDMKWSGVRHNAILDQLEIWKLGVLAASMSASIANQFPEKWEELYSRTFGLDNVKQESKYEH